MTKRKVEKLEKIKVVDIEQEIRTFILTSQPQLTEESCISYPQLLSYRLEYVRSLLKNESLKSKQLNELIEKQLKDNEVVADNLNKTIAEKLTLGQKTADGIAKFGGSWPFIFLFIIVLLSWITLNTVAVFFQPFDKYPFILLNLALSCLAAIQAPIIMMSQNRQEERDRKQAENDYKVNLKAEIEINLLHEKLDYLLNEQWQHLVEIQNIQLELLGELQEQIADVKEKDK
ncbi:DUF1003 domain-containing protein [Candidatus Enterococcus clewellii]|uniref:Cyclic nucleotide-binding protein n=1 Tax=Candidatus Enterococcus clewellii TaxID=1834193 RepID=A0A242K316_9ENTE|nr:DUF1003 domain-containing protein [Enterococcus sp. 9E7_DIV0242]OTP13388.1 hypothetical protein A5888_002866 [Enterococcus sp. 9E7_DIV0242]